MEFAEKTIKLWDSVLIWGEIIMEEKKKRHINRSKTQIQSKVYSQISFSAPKELVEEFREICRNIGISQASVFKKFIADFVEKYR